MSMIFLFQKNATKTTFKVPQVFMGRIIGRNGRNLRRLETKMGTKIYQHDFDDQFKQITIVGDPEKCNKTRRYIQQIVVSIKYLIFCIFALNQTKRGSDRKL